MQIKVVAMEEFDERAADVVEKVVHDYEHPNICFPAGDTPKGLYHELVKRYRGGALSLRNIRAIGLDEWGQLESNHSVRCISRMKETLYSQTDVNPEYVYFLEPNHEDIEAECRAYDALIDRLGGLTLSILGVGMNGHIGFNEPGSQITGRTRVVPLDDRTLAVGQKYGFDETPRWGVTVGLATINESKQILIMVNGSHKADIVYQLVNGPATSDVPASLLRDHPNCTLLLDSDAASLL